MPKIEKVCEHCSNPFFTEPKYLKRGHGKFCSLSCANRHNKKKDHQPNCTCAQCGVLFYRQPSKFANSKSGIFFCSRLCKEKAQCIGGMILIQPPHYGTGESPKSYRRSKKNKCSACGYDRDKRVLDVHHIDKDRLNNKQHNLATVCPTCHREIHLGIRQKEYPFSF